MDQAEKTAQHEEPIKTPELNMIPILVALVVGFVAVGKKAHTYVHIFTYIYTYKFLCFQLYLSFYGRDRLREETLS